MNSLDCVLAIPLILGAYGGFKRGFVVELVSFLLLIFGLVKGIPLFHILLPAARCRFPLLADYAPIALALLLLAIGGVVIYLVTLLIRYILNMLFLGTIDSLLGALVGFCKSVFFVSLFLYAWSSVSFMPFPSACIANSTFIPLFQAFAKHILSLDYWKILSLPVV